MLRRSGARLLFGMNTFVGFGRPEVADRLKKAAVVIGDPFERGGIDGFEAAPGPATADGRGFRKGRCSTKRRLDTRMRPQARGHRTARARYPSECQVMPNAMTESVAFWSGQRSCDTDAPYFILQGHALAFNDPCRRT